ncbi:uncharacterized protein K02A2.6-like [Pecten maximus]|uniref:uncharacterized protein K02A2.6-like n=1 Tax=Pecten maximus TaxID=6579 RepID=UPI001458338B|nr:uncharacterized protein K02A2.6-like [Pecten maximus]
MEALVGSTPMMDWQSQDLEFAWKTFKQHVTCMFSGPLLGKTEPEKCAYLMIWAGEKGRNMFTTWNLTEDQQKELKYYYEHFEQYVKPRSNVIYNRYKFHSKTQGENETFEQFTTQLQISVRDCNYENSDEMVRDRIVIGVRNSKIREKLINIGNELTLNKALDIARTHELSHAQAKSMSGEDARVHSITKAKSTSNYKSKRAPTVAKVKENTCTRCGYSYTGSSRHENCPAFGKTCLKCQGKNHFAKLCKTKNFKIKKKIVHALDQESSEDEFYVGYLETEINSLQMEWIENITVEDKSLLFQLDTGAMCNVISLQTLTEINALHKLTSQSVIPLRSYSGHVIKPEGKATLKCKYKEHVKNLTFHVVNRDVKPILGAQSCKEMELVQRVNNLSKSVLPADLEQFVDVFEGLGCLPGIHKIQVNHTVQPVVHAPRKIPIAIKDKVKAELDRMEKEGVIVKQSEPTLWVNSMVTVSKPNGKIRVCVDPRDLNKAILREHYPMKTVEDIILEIPEAKIFSKLDATSGFWQVCLDEESSKLCTFNSPFGRYRFTRLPFGIKSAPEVYQRIISEMVQDIEGSDAIVDDILVWGANMKEHDERLKRVLGRVREYNLTLSKDKCQFRKDRVTYVGHELSDKGVKPDPEKVRAVQEMDPPRNKEELMTFLGFLQYLGKFLPSMSEKSAPLRQLLQKDIAWHWEEEHMKCFETLKDLVIKAPVLRYYDKNKELVLTVDASSKGLGAALVQEGQPIAFASRALTTCQQNYAQIEKETLAIAFGCTKFHQYVFGRHVLVESDHKPLQSIFTKPLFQAPPRLQRILLTLQKYDLKVSYKPGKEMFLADTLSRAFLKESNEDLVPDIAVNEVHLLLYLPVSPEKLQEFRKATAEDVELQQLQKVVLDGWPDRRDQISLNIRQYWDSQDEISCVDGLLFKGHKLVVPRTLRPEMLKIIHSSHLGIVKCKSRARDTLFWPGMSSEVEDVVSKCSVCAQHINRNPKEPLVETEIPNRPWSIVSADIFEYKGQNYLLSVDHYSKWPEVAKLDNMSSNNTIQYIKSQCSRYGIMDKLITDNGPQFASAEFNEFTKQYGIQHETSSPHYAQSNGQAERCVQTVKNLLRKADNGDPYKALLVYRNTAIEDIKLSPAQMFLGRRLKSYLPTTAPLLSPGVIQPNDLKSHMKARRVKQKFYYDRHSGPALKPLNPGDNVIMQKTQHKQWIPATVSQKHHNPRSYIVETSTGSKYRRNRKYLRLTKAEFPNMNCDDEPFIPTVNPPQQGTVVKPDNQQPSTSDNNQENANPPMSQFGQSTPQKTRSGRIVVPNRKYRDYVT